MNKHSLILENREYLRMSGVKSTQSFGENEIAVYTESGDLMIRGSGLEVGMLDMTTGEFELHGKIDEISYISEGQHIPGNVISRLFR